METDSKAMIGFLRAIQEVQADVVVQRTSSGHTNIVTKQTSPRLDLRPVVALLRGAEATKRKIDISRFTAEDLARPGWVEGLAVWYYDTAANTIQNGGAAPEGVSPTQLSLETIRKILERTLPTSMSAA
jgi:hypothetical protein